MSAEAGINKYYQLMPISHERGVLSRHIAGMDYREDECTCNTMVLTELLLQLSTAYRLIKSMGMQDEALEAILTETALSWGSSIVGMDFIEKYGYYGVSKKRGLLWLLLNDENALFDQIIENVALNSHSDSKECMHLCENLCKVLQCSNDTWNQCKLFRENSNVENLCKMVIAIISLPPYD